MSKWMRRFFPNNCKDILDKRNFLQSEISIRLMMNMSESVEQSRKRELVLGILYNTLGEQATKILGEQDSVLVETITMLVVDDHRRENTRKPKDLQLALAANICARIVEGFNLPSTKKPAEMQLFVDYLGFDPEFTNLVKQTIIDNDMVRNRTIRTFSY